MCAVCDRGLGRPSLVAEDKPPWVLYNYSSLQNMPCLSSSTSRSTLCGLQCLARHDAGLLATFVPSLANGTTRNRCCRVGVAALVAHKSSYTKACLMSSHVEMHLSIMTACVPCHFPIIRRFQCILPHLASTRRPVYADANLLLPLSRLPNRKKMMGNLHCCALATTKPIALGQSYGAIARARKASKDVAHW